jgi:UDP-N-acetylmuramoyl-tripeptide--D-alanyl-D-alanine ligase
VITYGTSRADQNGRLIKNDTFTEVVMNDGLEIRTRLVGGYNFPNILAAVCIGRTFKVPDKDIKHALENYTPGNSRSQLLQKGSNKILLDAYNANPSSMKAAIENFASMPGKKVLMLGAMKELGKISEDEHQALIKMISAYSWKIILVGNDFKDVPKEILHFPNSEAAADWAITQHFSDTSFLVKGSRSMQMEKVVDAIKE